MGTTANQIATEGDVKNNTTYAGNINISSSTTNNKCITVNRVLQGLIETGNTPTYNTTINTRNDTYQIKTYAASVTTSVNLSAGYAGSIYKDSHIINGNATNYGSYPFSTGTGFLVINTNCARTINATLTVTCVQIGITTGDDKIYGTSVGLALQIYNGTVDGEDRYATLCEAAKSVELPINSNTSSSITLNIPTSKVFTIDGPPTGAFKFRLIMTGVGLGTFGSAGVSAKITTTVPYIAFNVYNPGPKCIKYDDLQYVYPLYGK